MSFRRLGACTVMLALGLCASANAAPKPKPTGGVAFSAPARFAPAGPLGSDPYSAVLPSGRIVKPVGTNVVVGMNPLGVALSPDGRYAIISNNDERQAGASSTLVPGIGGGYSLTVVDTATMRVVEQDRFPDERYFVGVIAEPDPRNPNQTLVLASGGPDNVVHVYDLDASGHLTIDTVQHEVAVPGPIDPHFGDLSHAFPGSLVASADGTRVYVVDELGSNVTTIDLATRHLVGDPAHVGFFPYGIARAGSRLLVTNEGLMRYGVVPTPTMIPPFGNVAADLNNASSVSLLNLANDGTPQFSAAIPMDRTPDGLTTVGGAHPSAIVATPEGSYAFVAMTTVDRIATIDLRGPSPVVSGGTELRLFNKAPYGTQPDALAISRDGRRLYVALAGLNAVAVLDARDPIHLHRLGLIPCGWFPTALTLSPDDKTLFVTNAKGFGHDRDFHGGDAEDMAKHPALVELDSNDIWGTLERIDLASLNLVAQTKNALNYARSAKSAMRNPLVPQVPSAGRSQVIDHVVVILEENKTYDSMLGDLTDSAGQPYGPGSPDYVSFGATVTPNLHALARDFGLAGNFFADAEESDAGHQFAAGGIASVYSEKTLLVKGGRSPLVNKNEDPEDYPRAGYIFNNLARHHLSYRDYGDLIRLSGYDEGRAENRRADDPNYIDADDRTAPTKGLGGLYSLDVPAPSVLAGHTDLNYPGWNLYIRDERRAHEFIRDYSAQVAAGKTPTFTYIWLPADHTGSLKGLPPLAEQVADGDRALGMVVEYLSHLPTWKSTAIFLMPDDAQSTRDHVNSHRSYALVISPHARRHHVGMVHLSTVSVLKTAEELLGLPALSLGDLLASDMSDFFTSKANLEPYRALPVATQHASIEGMRIAQLLERTDQSRPDADSLRSGRLISLSRRADALAAQRNRFPLGKYQEAQERLYEAALRVVASPEKE